MKIEHPFRSMRTLSIGGKLSSSIFFNHLLLKIETEKCCLFSVSRLEQIRTNVSAEIEASNFSSVTKKQKDRMVAAEWERLSQMHGPEAKKFVDLLYARHSSHLDPPTTLHVFNKSSINFNQSDNLRHELVAHNIPNPFAKKKVIFMNFLINFLLFPIGKTK